MNCDIVIPLYIVLTADIPSFFSRADSSRFSEIVLSEIVFSEIVFSEMPYDEKKKFLRFEKETYIVIIGHLNIELSTDPPFLLSNLTMINVHYVVSMLY